MGTEVPISPESNRVASTSPTPTPVVDVVPLEQVIVETVPSSFVSANSEADSRFPTMEIATVQPKPEFIDQINPPEYSIVPEEAFTGKVENSLAPSAGEEVRLFESAICLRPVMNELVEPGDDFSNRQGPVDRMKLLVDGNDWGEATKTYDGLLSIPDEDGTTFTVGADFCWWVPESFNLLGRHEVTFRFTQTSGNVKEYTWYFEVVE